MGALALLPGGAAGGVDLGIHNGMLQQLDGIVNSSFDTLTIDAHSAPTSFDPTGTLERLSQEQRQVMRALFHVQPHASIDDVHLKYAEIGRSRVRVAKRLEAVAHQMVGRENDVVALKDLNYMYNRLEAILEDRGHTSADIEAKLEGTCDVCSTKVIINLTSFFSR